MFRIYMQLKAFALDVYSVVVPSGSQHKSLVSRCVSHAYIVYSFVAASAAEERR